jgi:hypothetical protein
MASTFSDLKFELIGTGDQAGNWGQTTNDNIGTAIEQAITGLGNPVFTTDADLTIGLTDTVALQTARALVLNVTSTGSLTATRELVVPTIEKQYLVQNNTTGAQSITVKTAAGTGITVPNGSKMHLYVDGVNVVQAVSHFNAPTITDLVFDGDYTEEVFTITDGASVDLDPSNGTVQLWTLGDNRSPTATGFDSGQSLTLLIDDGAAYAITWPSVVWTTNGGVAPTLNTTDVTVIQLWKVSTVLYGARVGDA